MLKHSIISLLCLLIVGGPACTQTNQREQTYAGRAVKIIDGDTFDLLMDNTQRIRVRLHGIYGG